MSDPAALADAVLALYPADLVVHDTTVPRGEDGRMPAPPWILVLIRLPEPSERALSRVVHKHRVVVRSLIYGATVDSVRVLARHLQVLEGARPSADGWNAGRMEQINAREPVEDPDATVMGTDGHPVYAVLEHAFHVSPTA